MKLNKYTFYTLFIISVILFLSSFAIFIGLSVAGNVLKKAQPKLGYGLLIAIVVCVILSIILHMISIPFAIKYYKYRFFELNDNRLILFNIFYVLVAMFVVGKWTYEKEQLTNSEND
ncbi:MULTISPECIES: hypothetical protein [unclassified Mycoplasma]|uniref:hypothetical protein n=1 Tax=unclassified Mycoplasma TaxID=2683645 RepID=UPI00216AEFFE|nr:MULTISPECIES: hypothetical protein [unclassified Mycoplasma]MCS4536698.1 hypothetical protein [Mycoplasma sp. CSL7475-4]MCT4469815.1 hypothetical protein [Mycoplasma sp. HS2188]